MYYENIFMLQFIKHHVTIKTRKRYNMTNEEIKKDINVLLIKEGKQKKDIAEKLGISRQGLTNILNKKHITIDDITKIADTMGYDVIISYKKRDV